MDKIGIIVAMGSEFQLVESLFESEEEEKAGAYRFVRGKIGSKEAVLMQAGIGKVCAAVGAVEMIGRFRPECILNTGVAGGIDEKLRVMDIVVGGEVAYHDVWCGEGNEIGQVQGMPSRYPGAENLLQAVRSVKTDVALWEGLICSGDRFITERSALEGIKRDFPEGLAVDMESGAIAQVCHIYGVPFLSCRIISDTPGIVKNHALPSPPFWPLAPAKSFEVLKQMIEKI